MNTAELVRQWKQMSHTPGGNRMVVDLLQDRGELLEFAVELFKSSTRQEAIRDLLILKKLFELKEQ